MSRYCLGFSTLAAVLLQLSPTHAEPVITSSPPATGVSPSGPLIFTFSEAMDPDLTAVEFFDLTTFNSLSTVPVWSVGNTILTCTPSPPFPANRQIVWSAFGETPSGEPLGGTPGGLFTTGTGTGGGGSGTNAITTFSVGKVHHYNQTSSGPPTPDPITPYGLSAVTTLASNRTATQIVLTPPPGGMFDLRQLPLQQEMFLFQTFDPNLSSFDATFPAGNYSFLVSAVSSNQTVVVNLPPTSSLPQPGVPHLTNYQAAQSVDPGQAFVLGWDAWAGATAAGYIDVGIGAAYESPDPGSPGALAGTARTFTIPAGTLEPNSTYNSRVGFFHFVGTTNSSQATAAYRATYTEFSLITSGGNQLVLTNANWASGVFSFDVLCTNGQTVTVEFTNALSTGVWPKLLTTVSAGSQVHVVSPQASSNRTLYYRARNGP